MIKMKKVAVLMVITLLIFFYLEVHQVTKAAPQLPSEPDKNEPTITIQEPRQNQTYPSTVHYSITVKKPSSWFSYNPIHGSIMIIKYKIDNNQEVEIADLPDYYSNQPLNYNGELTNLSEGEHIFQIRVHSCSYYNNQYDENNPMSWLVEQYYYIDTYANVTFTIQQNQTTPTPSIYPSPTIPEFPTQILLTLLTLTSIAIISIIVRKHQTFPRHKMYETS